MKSKVWTPQGKQSGPFNSLLGLGETIVDTKNGDSALVTEGEIGVDNQKSSVSKYDNTVVIGNDIDWRTGRKFSDTVAPYTAMKQTIDKSIKNIKKFADRSSRYKDTLNVQQQNYAPMLRLIFGVQEDAINQQQIQHLIEDYYRQAPEKRQQAKGKRQQVKGQIQDYYKQTSKYNLGKDKPGYRNGLDDNYWITTHGDPIAPYEQIIKDYIDYRDNNNVNSNKNNSTLNSDELTNSNELTTQTNIEQKPRWYNKISNWYNNISHNNDTLSSWGEQLAGMSVPIANALRQNTYWNSQPISKPNTYLKNNYADYANNILAKMKVNPYQEVQKMYEQVRQAKYGNSQAGGLTAAQRNINNLALDANSASAIGSIYNQANIQNNQYAQMLAQAMHQSGQEDRSAAMAALQHDYDQYIRSHGRKVEGIEKSMANLGNIWQQMAADRNTIRIADKNLGIYQQNANTDVKKVEAAIKDAEAKTAALKEASDKQYELEQQKLKMEKEAKEQEAKQREEENNKIWNTYKDDNDKPLFNSSEEFYKRIPEMIKAWQDNKKAKISKPTSSKKKKEKK